MALRLYIISVIILFFAVDSHGQGRPANRPALGDTTIVSRELQEINPISDMDRVDRFYDSIKTKSDRRGYSRVLHDMFFRRPSRDTTVAGEVIDEALSRKDMDGLTIGSITIERKPIFDAKSRGLRRYANAVHVQTRECTIRRDLLFDVGDEVDMDLIVNNEQLLRSRAYTADANIVLRRNELDSTLVDVVVVTEDRWTISFDGQWRGDQQAKVEMYDANVAGLGDRLSVQTLFKRTFDEYGGNVFTYTTDNILGSFFSGKAKFGKDFDERYREVGVYKDFIKRSDYMLGAYYDGNTDEYNLVYTDSTVLIKYDRYDVWAGRSMYIPSARSSLYLSGAYTNCNFRERPIETGPKFNPDYQDYELALFNIGLYRERFYLANLIHGFGYKEYLASGYNLELLWGYRWGEYDDDWYVGASFKKGGFSPYGYFMGSANIGSYISPDDGAWNRGAVNLDANWFSNLFVKGNTQIRQFVRANYTRGFNREEGFREVLRFSKQNGPLTIKAKDRTGLSRAVLNTESVFFTPYQPFGFRLALYGFLDFGTIGYDANIFQNTFFSTVGIGVRLKNERLVFKTIQFQLGFTFNKAGFVDNSVRLSNEQRTFQYRYRPGRPETIPFK